MQLNYETFDAWISSSRIAPKVASDFGLYHDGDSIVIPVHDETGKFSFNKYRRSPEKSEGPKYWYDRGGQVTLYGYHLAKGFDSILMTEGEKDCLVAWSNNIPAVSSTGGSQSFQEEWFGYMEGRDMTICFDNDRAGAEGLVKALRIFPHAKVLLLPDMPNVKDIADYVNAGGDLRELMRTARHYASIQEVASDRLQRIALFKSVHFHDAYIKANTKVAPRPPARKSFDSDEVTSARDYPMTEMMEFRQSKARCPWHSDHTPSLQYYERSNSCYCFGGCGRAYDAIDLYRLQNNCSFKDAVEELNRKLR